MITFSNYTCNEWTRYHTCLFEISFKWHSCRAIKKYTFKISMFKTISRAKYLCKHKISLKVFMCLPLDSWTIEETNHKHQRFLGILIFIRVRWFNKDGSWSMVALVLRIGRIRVSLAGNRKKKNMCSSYECGDSPFFFLLCCWQWFWTRDELTTLL